MNFPLSIIIPTHNRPRILMQTLDCIADQTINDLEVIVVSDGPDDKTADMFAGLDWPFAIQYFAIPKSQQGVCRNRAFEKARGDYVLLIGDDIFLAPDACERHLKAHEAIAKTLHEQGIKHIGAAVLGFTTWDPKLRITPLMQWMEKIGLQFGYPKIKQYAGDCIPSDQQHWFTYTSNISLPSKLLHRNKFREDAHLYGWEDMEWGKRLAEANIPLFYESNAKGFHHHQYEDAEVWNRSRLLGESAVKIEKLSPGMRLVPRGWKRIAYYFLSIFPTYRGKHCREFLRGMKT